MNQNRNLYEGKVFDAHSHFSVETSAIAEDADEIGFTVHNKTIEEHVDFMDRVGISRSIISDPTVKYMDDRDKCKEYCRIVNETGSKAVKEYPERFQFAASLPLPYTEDALEELRYAVEQLDACAVLLSTNYGGVYLGDPVVEPVLEKAAEYGLPVLLHPTAPKDYPKKPITGQVLPMFEFIADTTRTVLDMLASGVLVRNPNLKIVVPHSGACLPVALDRFKEVMKLQEREVTIPLDCFYFDLACNAFPRGISILMKLTDTDHILYGTDYPPVPESTLQKEIVQARNCTEPGVDLQKILWENAEELFGC